jgi:hypothetical protein
VEAIPWSPKKPGRIAHATRPRAPTVGAVTNGRKQLTAEGAEETERRGGGVLATMTLAGWSGVRRT